MSPAASQITSLTIVYSIDYSGTDQRKHQSSASLAFVWGIHRRPVNSPAQMANNAENVSIWWRHHEFSLSDIIVNSRKGWRLHYSNITYDISNHPPARLMFVQQPFRANNNNGDIEAPNYWLFVRKIHRVQVYSVQKGPVIPKMFPCYDVIKNVHTS